MIENCHRRTFRKRVKTLVFIGVFFFVGGGVSEVLAQKKTRKEYRFKGSRIEGVREKPKDVYILPWQGTTLLEDSQFSLEFFHRESGMQDRYQVVREGDYYQRVGILPYP